MKQCTKCHEAKPLDAFSKNVTRRDGLRSQCRACEAEYHAKNRDRNLARMVTYNAAHRETHRTDVAEWRAAHPDVDAAHRAKRRAIKRNAAISPIPHGTWAQLHSDCKAFELLTGEPFAIDHIVPLARGGAHSTENLRPLPARLNSVKGAKLDHEVTSDTFQSHLAATGSSFESVTWRSFHCGSDRHLSTSATTN